ncbi:MAG TPA: hypothetical protein VG204_19430 [Terriglobia bacterium]|nr:hypothetical protein [Terriglobia bacterium]
MPSEFSSAHYYIEHRDDLPRAVFGRIAVITTSGRENPPQPLSGFACDRTPFAKGHIMALELGGPDISANIVPQYGLWQGNGEWRTMETTLAKEHNGHLFAARLFYNFASHDYAGQFQRCSNGEVFDWNHYCIPTRIDVWVLDAQATRHPAVSHLTTALSAPAADEKAFAEVLDIISRLEPETPPVRFGESHYQYEMPDIDRKYWLGQHVFQIIDEWWTDYKAGGSSVQPALSSGRSRRSAKSSTTPPPLDDLTFTYAGTDAVKQALRLESLQNGAPMWEESYLNETVTPEFCVSSRFKSVPARRWKQLQQNQVPFPYTPKNGDKL